MMAKDRTRIYLIRHGEVADAGPITRYNGQRDVDLSPNGFAQMEEMARRLVDYPIAAIYCSDLQRTVKGAKILARDKGLSIDQRPLLREKNFGAWEGMTHREVEEGFPEEWRNWLENPALSRPPGGETFQEVRERVLEELSRLLKQHRGDEIILLAHGGVNRVILCHALKLEIGHVFRIEQKFAALNIIDFFENGMASVHLMNG